jgi:hypothetical protein
MISGPLIMTDVVVPEHTERVLDLTAYWNLDFDGELLTEDDPPTLLYAKVAFPVPSAARHQFDLEQLARQAMRARKAGAR